MINPGTSLVHNLMRGAQETVTGGSSNCPWRNELPRRTPSYGVQPDPREGKYRQPEAVALRKALPSVNPHIGRLLRRLRDDRRLSQAKLASAVGVDTSYISKLEGGHVHSPSPAVIEKLGEVLGMDSEILFSFCGTVSPRLVNSLSGNPLALRFTRIALEANLTDSEWQEMLAYLAKIRNN